MKALLRLGNLNHMQIHLHPSVSSAFVNNSTAYLDTSSRLCLSVIRCQEGMNSRDYGDIWDDIILLVYS